MMLRHSIVSAETNETFPNLDLMLLRLLTTQKENKNMDEQKIRRYVQEFRDKSLTAILLVTLSVEKSDMFRYPLPYSENT